MNCVILQPSYIPWRGYFHQMQKADTFVFFDDVQYTKKSWRSRNRIKGPQGAIWLTIPVHARGVRADKTAIDQIHINWDRPWNRYHRTKLHEFYKSAPFYSQYSGLLDRFYESKPELLADFTIELSVAIGAELGLTGKTFLRSSQLGVGGDGTQRVLEILRAVGATHFINGPTAKQYTDEQLLRDADITLEYMKYEYPEYPQLHWPFDPQVSILDLLFMVGGDAPRYIWTD